MYSRQSHEMTRQAAALRCSFKGEQSSHQMKHSIAHRVMPFERGLNVEASTLLRAQHQRSQMTERRRAEGEQAIVVLPLHEAGLLVAGVA